MGYIIYFDNETTGLYPGQIAQMAVIIEDMNTHGISAKNYWFSIENMPQELVEKFGRDKAFYDRMSYGMTFATYANEIAELFNNSETIIAHNVTFDSKFLRTELARVGIIGNWKAESCSMKMFKEVCRLPLKTNKRNNGVPRFKDPRLEEVVDYYNLDKNKIRVYTEQMFSMPSGIVSFHDAMFDTTAMFICCMVYREQQLGNDCWLKTFRDDRKVVEL